MASPPHSRRRRVLRVGEYRYPLRSGDRIEQKLEALRSYHCPEVALVGDEVQIGEAGNLVVLKKAEWNVLVDAIKSGRLSKV